MKLAATALAAALLTTTGCFPNPDPTQEPEATCYTRHGMLLVGSDRCEELAAAVEKTLAIFAENIGPRWGAEESRAKLFEYSVVVVDSDPLGCFISPEDGARYCGLTWFGRKEIWIGGDSWDTYALPHEIAHAIQGDITPDHRDWRKDGKICDAIALFVGQTKDEVCPPQIYP